MASPQVLTLSHSPTNLSLTLSNPPTISLFHHDRLILTSPLSGLPATVPTISSTPTSHTLTYPKSATLSLSLHAPHYQVSLAATRSTTSFLEAAIPLKDASWFGLGHLMVQHWPLDRAILELGPFYPFDNGPNGVCTLIDPTLVSTTGALLIADDSSRCLHLGLNATPASELDWDNPLQWGVGVANFDRKLLPKRGNGDGLLRLQSRATYDVSYVRHPWLGADEQHAQLHFTLGAGEHVRDASEMALRALRREIGRAVAPPLDMMQYPIWSTWARYKDAVCQQDVIQFANEIVARGLPRSVMGIDDRWSVKYGDLGFDAQKFPDPKAMVHQLHHMGFKVTLWVTPFANLDSNAVCGEGRKYFVKTKDGEIGQFEWWQPTRVAALDVTDPDAREWFVKGLRRLCDQYGIDGFKFDAGEPSFLPERSTLQNTMVSPSEYTRTWIHEVASKFEYAEVRSGVRGCQRASPMFRMFDKFSTWGLENGLASVLAALLTSGMLGYPFCLPDYIAGNAYGDETPDAELMIRWTQATSAMPAMQFSIPPWSMGEKCERLVFAALEWRKKFFWKHIEAQLEEAAENYKPIARPMWWEEPTRKDVIDVCDQFMLGQDVVVAPIVNKGESLRRVFLPTGFWRRVNLNDSCSLSSDLHKGPAWIEQVSAALSDMPTYVKVSATT